MEERTAASASRNADTTSKDENRHFVRLLLDHGETGKQAIERISLIPDDWRRFTEGMSKVFQEDAM